MYSDSSVLVSGLEDPVIFAYEMAPWHAILLVAQRLLWKLRVAVIVVANFHHILQGRV